MKKCIRFWYLVYSLIHGSVVIRAGKPVYRRARALDTLRTKIKKIFANNHMKVLRGLAQEGITSPVWEAERRRHSSDNSFKNVATVCCKFKNVIQQCQKDQQTCLRIPQCMRKNVKKHNLMECCGAAAHPEAIQPTQLLWADSMFRCLDFHWL